jgi:hypothetical protein
VSGWTGSAGRGSSSSTARLLCRARPGTIKRGVLRAGPSGMAYLTIYRLGGREGGREVQLWHFVVMWTPPGVVAMPND